MHDCRNEILDALRVDIARCWIHDGYVCALAAVVAKSRSESLRGIYMLIKEMKFPVYGVAYAEMLRHRVYGLTAGFKIAGNVTKR